jgi:hypothetical protein
LNKSVLFVLVAIAIGCSPKTASTISTTLTREEIKIDQVDFDYLSIKSKIKFEEAGNTKNATAVIRLKKDSVIWFNLSGTLGMQGMRGIMTKDSILMINRVDKEYYPMTFNELSSEFNFKIDFQLLQAMILGEMPRGEQEGETISKEGDRYIIHQGVGNKYIDNYINATTRKVTEVQVLETDTENSLKLLYGDFREVNTHLFPFANFVSLIHTNEFGELETTITINHNKVSFSDKPLNFPFSVPKKYAKK